MLIISELMPNDVLVDLFIDLFTDILIAKNLSKKLVDSALLDFFL